MNLTWQTNSSRLLAIFLVRQPFDHRLVAADEEVLAVTKIEAGDYRFPRQVPNAESVGVGLPG
jgi:hypothetical protein